MLRYFQASSLSELTHNFRQALCSTACLKQNVKGNADNKQDQFNFLGHRAHTQADCPSQEADWPSVLVCIQEGSG